MARDAQFVTLPADTNQARGLAQYAIDFMWGAPGTGGEPGKAVLDRTNQFYTDACLTGISALALIQKNWTVFLDQPATEHEHILISAGQRGTQLRVPTMALVRLVRARLADVSTDKPEE